MLAMPACVAHIKEMITKVLGCRLIKIIIHSGVVDKGLAINITTPEINLDEGTKNKVSN